jgi:hypothetical protein
MLERLLNFCWRACVIGLIWTAGLVAAGLVHHAIMRLLGGHWIGGGVALLGAMASAGFTWMLCLMRDDLVGDQPVLQPARRARKARRRPVLQCRPTVASAVPSPNISSAKLHEVLGHVSRTA